MVARKCWFRQICWVSHGWLQQPSANLQCLHIQRSQWVSRAVCPSRSSFTTKMLRHRTQVVITDILFTTEYIWCIQDPVCSSIWLLPLNLTLIKCINTQKCHTGPLQKQKGRPLVFSVCQLLRLRGNFISAARDGSQSETLWAPQTGPFAR